MSKWACMQNEGREKRGGGREGRKGEEKGVEKTRRKIREEMGRV